MILSRTLTSSRNHITADIVSRRLFHPTIAYKMPSINVSLKEGANAEQLDTAKKQVTDQGGKIVNEFKLIKGFTAEFPADKVHTLSSNEHINVENDGKVSTQ